MSELAAAELVPLQAPGVGPAEFTHRLLARREVAFVRGPLRRVKVRATPPRVKAMRDMAVRATIGWLARSGGWQTRAVVAGGRRREGRIWASGIWDSLALGFSPASIELLVRAAAASAQPGGATLGRLARAVEGIPAASTTGDLVLFHLVIGAYLDAGLGVELVTDATSADTTSAEATSPESASPPPTPPPPRTPPLRAARGSARAEVERAKTEGAAKPGDKTADKSPDKKEPARPDPATEAQRARALLALSPLTALCRADELDLPLAAKDDAAARAAHARRFEPLVRGDRAVLLTYLDDTIARGWIARESARRAGPLTAATARRYAAMGAALEGLGDAALAAGRPDALRPIARFFEQYALRFGQREAVSRDLRERVHASVPLASERASTLARVARLFEASRPLEATADRVLDTPFVDRTEEDKVYVADYQERLRDLRPELEAIRRELAGEVG